MLWTGELEEAEYDGGERRHNVTLSFHGVSVAPRQALSRVTPTRLGN